MLSISCINTSLYEIFIYTYKSFVLQSEYLPTVRQIAPNFLCVGRHVLNLVTVLCLCHNFSHALRKAQYNPNNSFYPFSAFFTTKLAVLL
jgi:hypothetical protein